MNNSLEILTQKGSTIEINGEVLEIKAVKLTSLIDLTKALQGLTQGVLGLLASENGIVFEKGKEITINAEGWQLIISTVESNIENIITIMSIFTCKPREWFLDEETGIDMEDTIVLLLAIMERHYDFFMTRLAPIIKNLSAKKAAK